MAERELTCSFCGVAQALETPLIAGIDGHICEECVQLAAAVVNSWGRRRKGRKPLTPPPVPREIKRILDQHVIGQEAAKEVLAVAVYNHYKRLTGAEQAAPRIGGGDDGEVVLEKSNILLLGPSGTGKTLLARTLANIVGVPFAIADATTLTQAGYVGDDVESILVRLLDMADGDLERARNGIVYIDEIDKLARAGDSSFGMRDVSGEGVQQALLKLVEGAEVSIPTKGRRKEGGESVALDTRHILFIAGGAFAGLERLIEKRVVVKSGPSIGFHASVAQPEEKRGAGELFGQAQPDDLRRFGLIPEFIGRFPIIAPLEDLDEAVLVRILTEPRNALVKQYQALFRYEGTALEFTDEALHAIAATALARGTGARGLRSVLEQLLQRTMFDLPSLEGVTRCVVDEPAVTGSGPVRLEYAASGRQVEAAG